jgi:hypothetical protein
VVKLRACLTALSVCAPVLIANLLSSARLHGQIAPDALERGYLIALAAGWMCLVISRWRSSALKWALFVLYPFWMAPGMLVAPSLLIGFARML